MMRWSAWVSVWLLCVGSSLAAWADRIDDDLERIDLRRGIVAVVGTPPSGPEHLVQLCLRSELTVFFQTPDEALAASVRAAADQADLLGRRLFVEIGPEDKIGLGNNVADRLLIFGDHEPASEDFDLADEHLRVVRPLGTLFYDSMTLVKPVPEGVDDWSHPYHGPDNNPQSNDQLVRGSFRTQFLGFPKFSPMPEQTVIAGGRIYKAMGHIAHKANQNEML